MNEEKFQQNFAKGLGVEPEKQYTKRNFHLGNNTYQGYGNGDKSEWKGESKPYFSKEIADKMMNKANETGKNMEYNKEKDAYINYAGKNPDKDIYKGKDIDVNGQKQRLYPMYHGFGGWQEEKPFKVKIVSNIKSESEPFSNNSFNIEKDEENEYEFDSEEEARDFIKNRNKHNGNLGYWNQIFLNDKIEDEYTVGSDLEEELSSLKEKEKEYNEMANNYDNLSSYMKSIVSKEDLRNEHSNILNRIKELKNKLGYED